jgi:hypothetical protein
MIFSRLLQPAMMKLTEPGQLDFELIPLFIEYKSAIHIVQIIRKAFLVKWTTNGRLLIIIIIIIIIMGHAVE